MKRTEVNISSSFPKLNIKDRTLFMGSCFAQNIGSKFKELHLDAMINPLGVVFHPVPLFNLIDRALTRRCFKESDFFEFNDYWFCYELSGTCAQYSMKESVTHANKYLGVLRLYLETSNSLFVTLGSAVQREFGNLIVSNCHKQPNENFIKTISTPDFIYNKIKGVLKLLLEKNPNLKVSFSVSPIRHSKEGLIENSLSKSTLVLLCHKLASKHLEIEYLPVYEIIIDELRDYSFFNEDLIHPNSNGINFVWRKISEQLLSQKFKVFYKTASSLIGSINHKSMYPKSKENKRFLIDLIDAIQTFERKYNLTWTSEIQEVEKRLRKLE